MKNSQQLKTNLLSCFVLLFCISFQANGTKLPKKKSPLLDSLFEGVKPGESIRTSVEINLGTNVNNKAIRVKIPLILLKGAHTGPRLVIWSGVHGGEFLGIEALEKFASLVDPRKLNGQLVLCPVVNPIAVFKGRLGISQLDGLNLNREFPGKANGKPTQRLAHWLRENMLFGADAFIDLHSGGIDERLMDYVGYRKPGFNPQVDGNAKQLAHAMGFANVIYSCSAEGGNSHEEAARLDIPAALVEMGELGECRDEVKIGCFLHGLSSVLVHLKMQKEKDRAFSANKEQCSSGNHSGMEQQEEIKEWRWKSFQASETEYGLWYPKFKNSEDVHNGQTLGHVLDVLTGKKVQIISSNVSGRVIYSMNALTVTAGTELIAIAIPVDESSSTTTC